PSSTISPSNCRCSARWSRFRDRPISKSAVTVSSWNVAGSADSSCRRLRPSGAGTPKRFWPTRATRPAFRETPGATARSCSDSKRRYSEREASAERTSDEAAQRLEIPLIERIDGDWTRRLAFALRRFEQHRQPTESRVVDEAAKWLETEAALPDVLVAIDSAPERLLRIVQMECLQPLEADEPPELLEG